MGACHWCEYNELCGGSRARARALTSDYMAAEPHCVLGEEVMNRHLRDLAEKEKAMS
jgi:MoaA/NifB/PqqE/SkfB family radical SAM enzyme